MKTYKKIMDVVAAAEKLILVVSSINGSSSGCERGRAGESDASYRPVSGEAS